MEKPNQLRVVFCLYHQNFQRKHHGQQNVTITVCNEVPKPRKVIAINNHPDHPESAHEYTAADSVGSDLRPFPRSPPEPSRCVDCYQCLEEVLDAIPACTWHRGCTDVYAAGGKVGGGVCEQ